MRYCAFIYTPHLKEADIRIWLDSLKSWGVTITHLGKHDPPKRWTGDRESALKEIIRGRDLTNYTFFRDSTACLEFELELHRDPRWESDTISLSSKSEPQLVEIVRNYSEILPCHAAIVGISGGGKEQIWQIVHLNQECPTRLRDKIIKNAEPSDAANP